MPSTIVRHKDSTKRKYEIKYKMSFFEKKNTNKKQESKVVNMHYSQNAVAVKEQIHNAIGTNMQKYTLIFSLANFFLSNSISCSRKDTVDPIHS